MLAAPEEDRDPPEESFTQAFYEGGPAAMSALYRTHFSTVKAAVAAVLPGADGETAIHEVFLRLISNEQLRRAYRTGSFSNWLFTVARHHAIDCARRRARETPAGLTVQEHEGNFAALENELEARALIRKFRDRLPTEWLGVFDARFVDQLDQRQAARAAGVPRTTLVYREHRIRSLLRAFLLDGEREGEGEGE
jgi:RNA polymerase sigma-70 factor (ECF subfamily)